MRCKKCEYRLWNLTERRCPECGTPFRPSDYEFIPNSVQFRCPHCGQSYYGTGSKGHLVPAAFDCISCGQAVHMDEMVLFPTEGVQEEQTAVDKIPWLERKKRGGFRGWLGTVGMALGSPIRLMRTLPLDSSAGQAFWFAVVTQFLVVMLSLAPFTIIPLVVGGGAGSVAGIGGFGLGAFAAVIALMLVWSLVTHGLVVLTGRAAGGLRRTFQAICYSSGANVLSAIPCFGLYGGWIWWLISAVLMVKEGQRVHGGRATLAVLVFPVVSLLALVGLYVWLIVSAVTGVSAMAGGSMQFTTVQTHAVAAAVRQHADLHGGRGPPHASELVVSGYVTGSSFVGGQTQTLEEDVPVGGVTLDAFLYMPSNQARRIAQLAAGTLPAGTVAHRLGDFVFTYHGMDLQKADPALWVVIWSPDPDTNEAGPPDVTVEVGHADGQVSRFPLSSLAARLAEQNALRAQAGLAALPDPGEVTHAKPAVRGP